MDGKIILLFVGVFCLACGGAQENNKTNPTTVTTFAPTTSAPSTSAPSTSAPDTSAPDTSAPVTSAPVTTVKTTKVSPVTHVTSTTHKPTPQPKDNGIWTLRHNGSICIMVKGNFTLTFSYNSTSTHKKESASIKLSDWPVTVVDGDCSSSKEQWIGLAFAKDWKLNLTFSRTNKNSSSGSYQMSNIGLNWDLRSVNVSDTDLKGSEDIATDLFKTSKTGYMCKAKLTLYRNDTVYGLTSIESQNLNVEAFQAKNEAVFSTEYDQCSEDSISNLVPIIVGACLGGLIIVVLIAYLIGRKRSRRGYESV